MQPNLLNCVSYDVLVEAADSCRTDEGAEAFINSLPEPYQSIFLWLCDTMAEVTRNSDVNMMTPENMG